MNYYRVHPEKAICLDVETTGVDPSTAEILQLSIIDYNGKVLFNEYIKPDEAEEWPGAERIHHISPFQVRNKPHLSYYYKKLKHIFNNAELIIAYNGDHYDIPIIARYGFPELTSKESFDIMLEFAPIYGAWDDYHRDYTWQKLSTCADYYGYSNSTASFHDSLEDVRATLYCYKKMISNEDENEEVLFEEEYDNEHEDFSFEDEPDDNKYIYTDEDAVKDTQPFWVGTEMEMEKEHNNSSENEYTEEDYEYEPEEVEKQTEEYYAPPSTSYYPTRPYDRFTMNELDEMRNEDSGFYPDYY